MLKHERYCGKWNRRWVLRWPNEHKCDGFQVTGAHLLFCSHQAHSGKGNPPLCTSVGGRQPIPCILVIALWSGRAVVSEPLPGCRKAKGPRGAALSWKSWHLGQLCAPLPERPECRKIARWGAGLILPGWKAVLWWDLALPKLLPGPRGGCALCSSDLSWLGAARRAQRCLPKCARC